MEFSRCPFSDFCRWMREPRMLIWWRLANVVHRFQRIESCESNEPNRKHIFLLNQFAIYLFRKVLSMCLCVHVLCTYKHIHCRLTLAIRAACRAAPNKSRENILRAREIRWIECWEHLHLAPRATMTYVIIQPHRTVWTSEIVCIVDRVREEYFRTISTESVSCSYSCFTPVCHLYYCVRTPIQSTSSVRWNQAAPLSSRDH